MPQVPSTSWTVLDVLSASRELAKTVDLKKVVTEQGKYFYKIALSEIVALLNSTLDPSYYTESSPLTIVANVASIAAIRYDRIIGIADSNAGQCIELSPIEFYSLGKSNFSHVSYDDDIVYCIFGNSIRFKTGKKVTAGTKTLCYQRQPNYPTLYDDTEFVDLDDKHIYLLIKRIYTLIILQITNDIPPNIAQEMQMDYQLITGVKQSEAENKVKDSKSVTFK